MRLCPSCGVRQTVTGWVCPRCGWKPVERSGLLFFAPELADQNDNFPPEAFDFLVSLEKNHPWFQTRNHLLLWLFKKYFPLAHNFFEVGCGNGFVLAAFEKNFPSLAMTGSEIYSQALGYAKKRLQKVELYQMEAKQATFDAEFDVLGAFDVLEHNQEDELVLANFNKALVPGGGLLLTVPQHPFLWSYVDEYSRHARRYRRSDLEEKLRRAGFEVLDRVSFVSILFPVMVLSRWMAPKTEYDPKRELLMSPVTRFVMEKIFWLERQWIHLGLRLPFGGSLIMIARKIRN